MRDACGADAMGEEEENKQEDEEEEEEVEEEEEEAIDLDGRESVAMRRGTANCVSLNKQMKAR